jgi:anti-sigma B factor antagonist
MIITKTLDNNALTIALEGRLDTSTSPRLEAELERSVADDVNELIFDFEKLEYMSSAGIRVVMAAEETMSGRGGVKLIRVNAEIMDIFEMTGLIDILNIE